MFERWKECLSWLIGSEKAPKAVALPLNPNPLSGPSEGHFQYGPEGFDLFGHLFEAGERCRCPSSERPLQREIWEMGRPRLCDRSAIRELEHAQGPSLSASPSFTGCNIAATEAGAYQLPLHEHAPGLLLVLAGGRSQGAPPALRRSHSRLGGPGPPWRHKMSLFL